MNPNFFKKTKIILLLLSIVYWGSCRNQVPTNTLAQQIKSSAEYRDYNDALQEVGYLITMKKYLPPTESQISYLSDNADKVKSEEDVHKLYKEAGIVGAEEYLAAEKKAFNAFKQIHEHFPEFAKLSKSEQNAILLENKISLKTNLDSVLILRKPSAVKN